MMLDLPGDDCLDESCLQALAEGRLNAEERSAALTHLGGCALCRDGVAELYSAGAAEGSPLSQAVAPGVCVGERYTLVEAVGEGAWGVVWSAVDERLARKVAVKLLRPERSLNPDDHYRIVREAEALARLSHPSVVAVYDSGDLGDRPYLVMDLIEGVPLPTYLAQARPSATAILRLFVQAGEGLAAAHRAAIVHRDFKPANLLVDASGRLQVTDFGLAAHAWADGTPLSGTSDSTQTPSATLDLRLTPTQGCLGTPAYLAPEVLRGEPATPLSDQFAFCVSLVEALTGSALMTPADILSGGVALPELRVRLRELPSTLRPVVTRGLDPDPARRYPHLDALLGDIRRRAQQRWLRRGLVGLTGIVALFALASYGLEEQRIAACVPSATPFATSQQAAGPLAADDPAAMSNLRAAMQEYQDDRLSSLSGLCRATGGRPLEAEAAQRAQFFCLEHARLGEEVVAKIVEEGEILPAISVVGHLQSSRECAELSEERVTAYVAAAQTGPLRWQEFMTLAATELLDDNRPELEALLASIDPSSALAAEVLVALGNQTANLGSENEAAIEYFERGLAVAMASANRHAALLAMLSLLQFDELDPSRSSLLLRLAEPLAASLGRHASFLSQRASLNARRGRFDEALADIDDALETREPATMLEFLGARRLMLSSLQTKAKIQMYRGEHALALRTASAAAREQLALLGPDAAYAVLLAQLGGYAERASHYDEALDAFEQAARLFADQGKPALELRSRVQQARQLSSLMRWDDALESLRQVEARAESLGLDVNVAEATAFAAYIHGVRGEWAQRAAVCARNESATIAAYGPTHVRTQQNAVFCLDGRRASPQERETLTRLVATLQSNHDTLPQAAQRTSRSALVRGHCELARAALQAGELDEAQTQARAALERAVEVPDNFSREAELLLAEALVRQGHRDEGNATLEAALRGARSDRERGRESSADLADHLVAASRILSPLPDESARARAFLDEARERLIAAGLTERVAELDHPDDRRPRP